MIIINSDTAVGTKSFMHELADAIRPSLDNVWSADEVENFDLCLLQEMIHFGDVSADEFNAVFDVINKTTSIDKAWQDKLLTAMRADPRFSKQAHAA